MNERIKKLAEEAGLEFDDDLVLESEPVYFTTQTDLEKFAELIVKQCANIVRNSSLPDSYSEACLRNIADELEEHFGVEL